MRADAIPRLVAILLALLAARGQAAESNLDERPPVLKALAYDFHSPLTVANVASVDSRAVSLPGPESGSDSTNLATPPKNTLTHELPGGVKFTPVGRLETDSVWVTQDPTNKANVGDLQNTTGFRRARIGAKLEISDNVEWLSEFDFSNSQFRITNVYLGLINLPRIGEIRVGQFREPFGLEAQTSSNHITYMERADNNSLIPSRKWGVAVFVPAPDRLGTLSMGLFRAGSDAFGRDSRDQNDMAYTSRVTRLLWHDDSDESPHLLHLGGAYSFRIPVDGIVKLSSQTGILGQGDSPLDPLLISPVIPADQDHRFGVELASEYRALSLQGEWTAALIHQLGGGPVFYHAAYLSASLFLTGEHRSYDHRKGAFGAVHVRRPFGVDSDWRPRSWHGIGAWQIAVRYSYFDLDDPNAPPAANGTRPGGILGKFTVGLNWYLNNHMRCMLDYTPAVVTNPNTGKSYAQLYGVRVAAFW